MRPYLDELPPTKVSQNNLLACVSKRVNTSQLAMKTNIESIVKRLFQSCNHFIKTVQTRGFLWLFYALKFDLFNLL